MGLILLEALLAMLLLVGIVWWTMFSGRNRGEPLHRDGEPAGATSDRSGPLRSEPPTHRGTVSAEIRRNDSEPSG